MSWKRKNVADFDNLSWQYRRKQEQGEEERESEHDKRLKWQRTQRAEEEDMKKSARETWHIFFYILLLYCIYFCFFFVCRQSAIGCGSCSGPTVLGVIPKGSKLKFIHTNVTPTGLFGMFSH